MARLKPRDEMLARLDMAAKRAAKARSAVEDLFRDDLSGVPDLGKEEAAGYLEGLAGALDGLKTVDGWLDRCRSILDGDKDRKEK